MTAMTIRNRRPGARAVASAAALASTMALAACGGGGGGVVSTPAPPATSPAIPPTVSTPTPVITPTVAPPPTPPSTPTPAASYDTAEYRATVGAVSLNALAAYNRGATGAGIAIGIVDSGIDLQSDEFAGRVSSRSADVAGNAGIDDVSGHGTAVAFTAAGRRNGSATHGVAFDATLIVLRADRPGTCTAATTGDDSCRFGTDAIARGLDLATTGGARVVNLSLGGSQPTQDLTAAIGRATAAGVVVVIAAGNDGTDNPDPFANVAASPAARGQVVIAGSINSGDAISSFSDRAGTAAANYLAAVGERVRAPNADGAPLLWSGTSFAAPQIAGAVALLAQAFPNLSGAQIVDLLRRTARDLGAPGVDAVYGNGAIDLTRAFQPVGTVTVAGSVAPISTTANAVLSTPMGDAGTLGTHELGAVILDGYGRAFATDLARTITSAAPRRTLVGVLGGGAREVALAASGLTMSVTLVPRSDGSVAVEPTRLDGRSADTARAVAGSVSQRLGGGASIAFGFARSGASLGAGLGAGLVGRAQPAFLLARDPAEGAGFDTIAGPAAALRQQVGRWGVTVAADGGDVLAPDATRLATRLALHQRWQRTPFDRVAVSLDRRFGPVTTRLAATRLHETATLLGARFAPALGLVGASSWFADAGARLDTGAGWTMGAAWRQGVTTPEIAGPASGGRLRTTAFAFDLGKSGIWGGDTLGLRIAQPLRVADGGVDLRLPTDWNYATAQVATWTTQRLGLAPTGRELVTEARYARIVGPGTLDASLYWRRNPANLATLPDDHGLALRYGFGF